jgi:antitoxin MazE
MSMQVARWGNSLALRLPASVVKALDLKEGDDVTIIAADERELAILRKPTSAELIERLKKYRGSLPADFKFDRLEANAR